jgi:3-keto-5-aminohexanoate cleavage enzyme
MTSPLIICVAVCGNLPMRTDNPALPYSAAEVAEEIIAAAEVGAAMAHVHARKPDGSPTQDAETFAEIVERVRARSDIILELSLGSRGFTLAESLAPLSLRPVMASFPMEIRKSPSDTTTALKEGANMLLEAGARPSFAITSPEIAAAVSAVIDQDNAGEVPCLVVAPKASDDPREAVASLLELTRPFIGKAHWWLMKGGRTGDVQYALRALTMALGGHVRVGFEDLLTFYDGTAPAPSNRWFVEQMTNMARMMGRPIATAQQARELLRLC